MSHTMLVVLFCINIMNLGLAAINFWMFWKVKFSTRWFNLMIAIFVLCSACWNLSQEWPRL